MTKKKNEMKIENTQLEKTPHFLSGCRRFPLKRHQTGPGIAWRVLVDLGRVQSWGTGISLGPDIGIKNKELIQSQFIREDKEEPRDWDLDWNLDKNTNTDSVWR